MTNQSKKRKFLATTLTATMVATAVAPVAGFAAEPEAAPFPDVPADHAYAGAITDMVNAGVINGLPNGDFDFFGHINRAQAAQMIAGMLNLNTGVADNATDFADVLDGQWYTGAVNSLVAEGIIAGKSATSFDPLAKITRAELVQLLVVAYGLENTNVDDVVLPFTDVAEGKWYVKQIKTLYKEGLISGISDTVFAPENNMRRGDFAWLTANTDYAHGSKLPKPVAAAPAVESVKAINATTAEVTFKGALPKDVDFTNFELDGGLTVSSVQLSANRKTATITSATEFTRDQEYTVSVYGILDADGKEYAEVKGSFTWSVAEGVTVALDGSTLVDGQTTGLTVKDAAGKDVKDAKVVVTSFNENIVKVTGSAAAPGVAAKAITLTGQDVAGIADVEVKTTLPDGTVLTNTFKVTVKETVTTIANAGYTLGNAASLLAATKAEYANTKAFVDFATATTSLVEGTATTQLIAYGKTNDQSDLAPIDFTGATKVTSSNPIVATAVLNSVTNQIDVDALKAGSTTVSVTMKDGSRKTFNITVTAKPMMKEIDVNATSVKLSDEVRNAASYQEGVNQKVIKVTALDQFKKEVAHNAEGKTPKVTVASSTDGITVTSNASAATPIAINTDIFSASLSSVSFYINAVKDTPVKNATVTVSYFADKDDAKPTAVKTIKVDVTNIASDAKTSDIDVIAASEIDANAENTASVLDAASINFTSTPVYALDTDGNRIEKLVTAAQASAPAIAVGEASVAITPASPADKYVDVAANILKFNTQADAITYLRAPNTINVDVTTDGVTKRLPITYKNTAVIPNKVAVATAPLVVKLPALTTDITIEDLIFGNIDATQLQLDDASTGAVAATGTNIVEVLKTAKNGGYTYNKPLLSFTGTDGKAFATGVNVYGTDTSAVTTGNVWYNTVLKGLEQNTPAEFSQTNFEVDYSVANVSDSTTLHDNAGTGAFSGKLNDIIKPGSGKTTTLTLVINGVYVKDALTVEGAGKTIANASDAEKAKHNLLASPTQLNVAVSEEK